MSVAIRFRGGALVSLSESFSSFAGAECCTVDCDAGSLVLGHEELEEVRADGQRIRHANPFDKAEATYVLLDDLLRAAAEGRPPETSAADNLRSMRILEAAYRSVEEERPIRPAEIE